jgi:predicted dienelactone hydrolase
MSHQASGDSLTPRQPGQAAFAAIAEVVRLLEADPSTDWSKVNIEELRQHLLDMDDVVMRSVVVAERVEGGARFSVTGSGRVVDAIRRMSRSHAGMIAADHRMSMSVVEIANGVRVTALSQGGSSADVAKIRALGFIGLLTVGEHHTMHHLMVARGNASAHSPR